MRIATIGHHVHSMEITRVEKNDTTTAGIGFTAQRVKGTPIMTIKTFAPVFFAVAAAAIISAPAAGAATSAADCDDDGPASVCTRNGHSAIYAEPRQTGTGFMIAPGGAFGSGPMPPMLAMD